MSHFISQNSLSIFRKLGGMLLIFICSQAISQSVKIEVDLTKSVGDMRPFYAYFGYDEPNYTTRADGGKLLSELADLSPVPVYVRTHNLLTSKGGSPGPDLKWGFTNAYSEDKNGKPIYNWIVVDSIIDAIVLRGMKPLMEIGFMPKDLSSKPEPYEHYWSNGGNIWTGWTYPPKDYKKWEELVYQWVLHSLSRYGIKEVKTWLWEVWNEPDIPYLTGTFDDYCKMYDFAAAGLKRACPECVIGGPHTTSPRSDKANLYLSNFIEHCLRGKNYATGNIGTPLQYIGFHAKGSPQFADGHITMDMAVQLKDVDRAFETINSFPELKNIPIIIGECDPEGCAACSVKRDPKYGYRNGTMYSSYTAASFARIYELMDLHKVNLQGVVSWSFEFEDQEWFAGFRELATHGVNKPVLNVFRMMGQMRGDRVLVKSNSKLSAKDIIKDGVRGASDVSAMASMQDRNAWILVWNYHDVDVEKPRTAVTLAVSGVKAAHATISEYRIDKFHSNSFKEWKKLGSPQQVDTEMYKQLERSGQLQALGSPKWKEVKQNTLNLETDLPSQGVSLLHIQW